MKETRNAILGSAALIVVAVFAVIPSANSQESRGASSKQYCLMYSEGGTDCSFSSYAQCQETAAGLSAECYETRLPGAKLKRGASIPTNKRAPR